MFTGFILALLHCNWKICPPTGRLKCSPVLFWLFSRNFLKNLPSYWTAQAFTGVVLALFSIIMKKFALLLDGSSVGEIATSRTRQFSPDRSSLLPFSFRYTYSIFDVTWIRSPAACWTPSIPSARTILLERVRLYNFTFIQPDQMA